MLIKCYYAIEDFDALEATIDTLSERHPLLQKISEMLVSVGLCSAAVSAYTKVSTWFVVIHFVYLYFGF